MKQSTGKSRATRGFRSAAVVVSLLVLTASAKGDNHNLRIHNGGDNTILEVHISSIQYDKWGPDLLGTNDVIAPGESYDFNIVQGCEEDIKLVYRDTEKVFGDFDTCKYDLNASY